ncbi:GntR family transcriptional regulator [Salana multivorans]
MIIHVDATSPVPVFEQLRSQIERLVVSGALQIGDRLPPIRQLASDLDLARGTVQRVYDELARAGIVESAGRHGTRVLAPPAGGRTAARGDAEAAADALAVVVRQVGMNDDEAVTLVRAALARYPSPPRVGEA